MRSDVIRSAKASKIATDQRIRCDLTTDLLGSGRTDVFLQLVVFWNWYEEKIDRCYKTWRAAVKKYALIVKPCKPNGRSNDALDDRSDDNPLRTHVRADGYMRRQITQDREIIFHHQCLRCGRDLLQKTTTRVGRRLPRGLCESSLLLTA